MDDFRIATCAVELRPKSQLGKSQSGGLSGRHHFSFAAYQRPDRLEWGALRALNFYRLEPGAARPPSFHAGFEIITLVLDGRLRRTGTFAPSRLLYAGAVELISTGMGANLGMAAAGGEPASYAEIWVRSSATTGSARRELLPACPTGLGHPVATGPAAAPGALAWRAAAHLHRIELNAGETLDRGIDDGTFGYLAILRGRVAGDRIRAATDDAIAFRGPGRLTLRADGPSEILLIQTSAEP